MTQQDDERPEMLVQIRDRAKTPVFVRSNLTTAWRSQASPLALYVNRLAIPPTLPDPARRRDKWDWIAAAMAFRDPEGSNPFNPFALDLDRLDRERAERGNERQERTPPWLDYFENRERLERDAREHPDREQDRNRGWDRDR